MTMKATPQPAYKPMSAEDLMGTRSRISGSLTAFLARPTNPARLEELHREIGAYRVAAEVGVIPTAGLHPRGRQARFAALLREHLGLVLDDNADPTALFALCEQYSAAALDGAVTPPPAPAITDPTYGRYRR